MSPFVRLPFLWFPKNNPGLWFQTEAVRALNAVPTALAIFPGCTPADPVKIHNVFFPALRAKALHFGFVVIDNHIEFFGRGLFGRPFDRFKGGIAFRGRHLQTLHN
jgi:hypothetical protein